MAERRRLTTPQKEYFIKDMKMKIKIVKSIHGACSEESTNGLYSDLNLKNIGTRAYYYINGGQKGRFILQKKPKKKYPLTSKQKGQFVLQTKPKKIYPWTSNLDWEACIPRNSILQMYINRVTVQKSIRDMYLLKRVLPCTGNLKDILDETHFSELGELKQLDLMGFELKEITGSKKAFIAEKSEFINDRFQYLQKIIKYREEGRCLVYVGEHDIAQKINMKPDQNKRVYVAVSPNVGLLNCDFLISSTIWHVTNWLTKHLSPKLAENTVMVIDKNIPCEYFYKSIPTKTSSKAEMITWLKSRDIPCNSLMHKAELLKLTETNITVSSVQYKLDISLRKMDLCVLRRPPWLLDLDYFYHFWDELIEHNFAELSKCINSFQLSLRVKNIFSQYTLWKDLEKELVEKEKAYMVEDYLIEDMVEKLVTMVERDGLNLKDTEEIAKLDEFNQIKPKKI